MRKTLFALAALMGLLVTAPGAARADYYGVAVATWTAGGNGTKSVAFQNTSTTQNVEVLRIDVSNATDGSAITGGLQMYWVYGSTAMTHGGTSQCKNYGLGSANASLPSALSFSTGPVNVTYENGSATSAALPLLRPLYVNNDDGATTSLTDSWQVTGDISAMNTGNTEAIVLPAGANRGIVIEQRQLAATSVTAGVLQARIFYRIK